MLRLAGYFACVFLALFVLRQVPIVGGLFRIPLFGFLLAIAMVGFAAERVGRALVERRRFERARRELGAVDTPHNRGKLGTLLSSRGQHERAIEELEAAVRGEPQSVEWRYRLGCALLAAGRPREARAPLEEAVARDPEHAYGSGLMRLAQACQSSGDAEGALAALARFERIHGATPESAYRRGLAHRARGERGEARRSFEEVSRTAATVARYQRAAARSWVLRAALARWVWS